MIVYCESNFVLELALEQEQSASCIEILNLARSDMIRLVIPAFSLAEPQATLSRRKQERYQLQQDVDRELQQLKRTAGYSERIKEFAAVVAFLPESAAQESIRLRAIISQLIECAELIPFDSAIANASIQMELRYALSPLDAMVFASVLTHLSAATAGESCFMTRDAKGFDVPDIVDELKNSNCRLFRNFDDGVKYLTSRMGNPRAQTES